jgi:hypothetical protein
VTAPELLTVDDVVEIHACQVERFGGSHGLRDRGLLESAVAQAAAAFAGEYVHPDLGHDGGRVTFSTSSRTTPSSTATNGWGSRRRSCSWI